MNKGVVSKKRVRADTAAPKLDDRLIDAVFHDSNIVLYCLCPFLSLIDKAMLLACDRRMHSFNVPALAVVRDCSRRYGNSQDVTASWIKRCIKARCVDALRFVLERTLVKYLKSGERHTARHTPYGSAMVAFMEVGFAIAFAVGFAPAITYMLQWYAHVHSKDDKSKSINRLFHYPSSKYVPSVVMPQAMTNGISKGHGSIVRHYLETSMIDLTFIGVDAFSYRPEMESRERTNFLHDFLMASVGAGDSDNYSFFLELYVRVTGDKSTIWAEDAYRFCLESGTSAKLLPLICELVDTPLLPLLYKSLSCRLDYAFKNQNHVVLEYVINSKSKNALLKCEDMIRSEYEAMECVLREALHDVQSNLSSKKAMRACACIQKRLRYLRFLLTDSLGVNWEEYRPGRSTFWHAHWLALKRDKKNKFL